MLLVVIGVLIALSYDAAEAPVPLAEPGWRALATLLAVVCLGLLAELFARLTIARIERFPGRRAAALAAYQRFRWTYTFTLLVVFTGIVHGLHWPAVVRQSWGLEHWVLVDDALVLSPFLAGLVLGWLARFRAEESAAGSRQTWFAWRAHRAQLDFLLRQQAGVVLVPTALWLALFDLVGLVRQDALRQQLEVTASVVGVVVTLFGAPLLLRLLWRARPLPAGRLRQRLEELSGRLRFRASDILIWNTGGTVINAAVAGLVPWLRYVMLSDGLIEHLDEDEIEAVFGHEVGHIRHRHLIYYVAFLQGSILFLLVALNTVGGWLDGLLSARAAGPVVAVVHDLALPLVCVAIYFGVFFGFLSRRFERQADLFGCRAVSCGRPDCPPHEALATPAPRRAAVCPVAIGTFVAALEKIARLNGWTREKRSWRHASVAKRVEFLERLRVQPELERRLETRVIALKLLVILVLVLGGWWAWRHPGVLGAQLFG